MKYIKSRFRIIVVTSTVLQPSNGYNNILEKNLQSWIVKYFTEIEVPIKVKKLEEYLIVKKKVYRGNYLRGYRETATLLRVNN